MFKSTHLLCKKTRDDKCVYTKAPLLRVLEKQRSSKRARANGGTHGLGKVVLFDKKRV